MNDELLKEWNRDRERINNISESLYDEDSDLFDMFEYACELEQLASKYLYRFNIAERSRMILVEEVAE